MNLEQASHTPARARLDAFVSGPVTDYARLRNFDVEGHPHVSNLSMAIRHRVLTEVDVLQAVLAKHSYKTVEKFVQEVFWRTYWKGWLERRPAVWTTYKTGLGQAQNRLSTEAGLRQEWEAACNGDTGIECFDYWARELAETGYLHNHARMWFASIWIFTLRLPWELGADFFLRHLIDGDAASNTLSWRWVGGLQTEGKTYLATADNIARFTENRFRPTDLAAFAPPLTDGPKPALGDVPVSDAIDAAKPTAHLITEDDLSPAWLANLAPSPVATATLSAVKYRSPLEPAAQVTEWTDHALRQAAPDGATHLKTVADTVAWAREQLVSQVVASYCPTGPGGDLMAMLRPELAAHGIALVQCVRPYDSACWQHATHGFFRFKEKIPKLLEKMDKF